VIRLTNEKKVTKENAFNIEMTSLENIQEYLKKNKDLETKWLRTGEAIGAGAKIYGFRVDNVHYDTYKMLNAVSRNGGENQQIDIV
jgi:condensin complex subunit 2